VQIRATDLPDVVLTVTEGSDACHFRFEKTEDFRGLRRQNAGASEGDRNLCNKP